MSAVVLHVWFVCIIGQLVCSLVRPLKPSVCINVHKSRCESIACPALSYQCQKQRAGGANQDTCAADAAACCLDTKALLVGLPACGIHGCYAVLLQMHRQKRAAWKLEIDATVGVSLLEGFGCVLWYAANGDCAVFADR